MWILASKGRTVVVSLILLAVLLLGIGIVSAAIGNYRSNRQIRCFQCFDLANSDEIKALNLERQGLERWEIDWFPTNAEELYDFLRYASPSLCEDCIPLLIRATLAAWETWGDEYKNAEYLDAWEQFNNPPHRRIRR
jgi:hypothetical protein